MCTFKFFRSKGNGEKLNIEEEGDNKFSDISFKKSTPKLVNKSSNKEQTKKISIIFQFIFGFLKSLGIFILIGILMGKEIGLVDLDIEPKEYPNGEILWCISVTYYRQNAEKFGELLREFDRISVFEASNTVTESTTNDDEEGYYADLPF